MNAKERLRQYLEQRRESGESEFVLDTMSVDEALALMGARGRAGAAPRRGDTEPEATGAGGAGSRAGRDSASSTPSATPSSGWREALRGIDAASPGNEVTGRTSKRGGSDASRNASRSDAQRAPSPTPAAEGERQGDSNLSPGRSAFGVDPRRAVAMPISEEIEAQHHGSDDATALDRIPPGIVVGSTVHELFSGPNSPLKSLEEVAAAVASCTRCPLYATAKNPVPGEGSPQADFVCVGEAPGASEDESGRPFVGLAGGLLTKILAAINLAREEVFICNVLKHRPPGNRNPAPEEVAACSPYLVRQIELLRPKVIVAFGTFAAQTLLQSKDSLGKLRGRIHRYYGVPLIVTYHPAALLRNPSWKRPTWEDVQLARKLLDRARRA